MDHLITYSFEDDGTIPNNPTLPLLICPGALPLEYTTATDCRYLLERNRWGGTWVNGIYTYHHYHSTAHEVLAVLGGSVNIIFGGKNGEAVMMNTGDVVYIPAGVGHCCVDSSSDFSVVGAYPRGQTWDLCTGKPDERPGVIDNIYAVPLPDCDAITGENRPLLDYWS